MDGMQLSSEIPQDIIDNIISELTGDSNTLKCCATVSQSFLHPSRRSLFAAIQLCTQGQTEQLHDLLTSVPEISLYIRELSFAYKPNDVPCPRHEAWLKKDNNLASVLKKLAPGLRVLSWGVMNSWTVLQWDDDFSNELQSALLDIFRSPSLTTITISNLECLPLSVFNGFTHVKKLTFDYVNLKGTSALPPFQLAQLEVLIVAVQINQEDAESFIPTSSSFPNLSFLLIDSGPGGISLFNQRIIESSTRSIERIIWNLGQPPNTIDLGIIENLQVVTLTSTDFHDGSSGWEAMFRSLINCLKHPSVIKSLNDLTIGLLSIYQRSEYLPKFKGWTDLDAILSSFPILQKILILIDIPGEDISTSQLQGVMQGRFPLLESRGILSVVSGTIRDLRDF